MSSKSKPEALPNKNVFEENSQINVAFLLLSYKVIAHKSAWTGHVGSERATWHITTNHCSLTHHVTQHVTLYKYKYTATQIT